MAKTNTGFTTLVNGVETDLINIFGTLTGTRLTYNTNYITAAGVDLRDIFEPYATGDASANPTNYITLSGGQQKDLNVIFGIPYIPPAYPTVSNSMPGLGVSSQICIYDKNVIVTNQNQNVYYSTNYGKTFAQANGVPSLSSSASYSLTSYGTNAMITYPGSPSGGQVYTSSNSGANWTSRLSFNSYSSSCSIYANYAMITFADANIYVSNNSGVSWTSITISPGYFTSCAISYDSTTGKYIAVCCNLGISPPAIYYCTNFTGVSTTTTFTKGTTNIQANSQNSISLVGRNGIALSNYAQTSPPLSFLGLWYTSNGGQTWTKSVNFSDLTGFDRCSLSVTGLGIAMRINKNDPAQYITRDYGVTWTKSTNTSISYVFALYNNILVSGQTSGGIVYWGTYS